MGRKGNRKEIYLTNEELLYLDFIQRYYKCDQTAALKIALMEGSYTIIARAQEQGVLKLSEDLHRLFTRIQTQGK